MRILKRGVLMGVALWGALVCFTEAVQNTWIGSSDSNWFTATNWSAGWVPVDGDSVVIDSLSSTATNILLTNSTAILESMSISNRVLTFSNWTTVLTASNITIFNNGVLTLPAAFPIWAMSNRVSLVASNFTLNAGGQIAVSGRGYSTTNGPGKAASGVFGGGGGHAGGGGRGYYGELGGVANDTASDPVIPGSGGGTGTGAGGAGGGVVRIEATNVIINGQITADGLSTAGLYGGGGAGGAIRILCRSFGGALTGYCSARGGSGSTGGGGGSGGLIAIHYTELSSPALVRFETSRGGGSTYSGNPPDPGSYGVVYFPSTNLFCQTNFIQSFSGVSLIIPGFTNWAPSSSLTISNGLVFLPTPMTLNVQGHMTIANGGLGLGPTSRLTVLQTLLLTTTGTLQVISNVEMTVGSLILTNGSSLWVYSCPTNAPTPLYGTRIAVDGEIVIYSNSWIYPISDSVNGGSIQFATGDLYIRATNGGFQADGAGYGNRRGIGKGGNGTLSSGGGYGGRGGTNSPAYPLQPAGITYGSSNAPTAAGSGGGGDSAGVGGAGGGLIWVRARQNIGIQGVLSANGGVTMGNYAGGGSGGGIYLTCGRFTTTAGAALRAEGKGGTIGGGGGGGGRICVSAAVFQHGGTYSVTNGPTSTYSGTPSLPAEVGTIVFDQIPAWGAIMISIQ